MHGCPTAETPAEDFWKIHKLDIKCQEIGGQLQIPNIPPHGFKFVRLVLI